MEIFQYITFSAILKLLITRVLLDRRGEGKRNTKKKHKLKTCMALALLANNRKQRQNQTISPRV